MDKPLHQVRGPAFFHKPFFTNRSPSQICYNTAKANPMARSATSSVNTSGVLVTLIPLSLHVVKSILSKPTLNVETISKLGSESIIWASALIVVSPTIKMLAHSRPSSSLLVESTEGASSENFTSMSREFNALVLTGSSIDPNNGSSMDVHDYEGGNNNLGRIREEDLMEETNSLAIVPDYNPLNPVPSPRRGGVAGASVEARASGDGSWQGEVSVLRVKKEEVEAKISAWQNVKVAKINNKFQREDVIINGWEMNSIGFGQS